MRFPCKIHQAKNKRSINTLHRAGDPSPRPAPLPPLRPLSLVHTHTTLLLPRPRTRHDSRASRRHRRSNGPRRVRPRQCLWGYNPVKDDRSDFTQPPRSSYTGLHPQTVTSPRSSCMGVYPQNVLTPMCWKASRLDGALSRLLDANRLDLVLHNQTKIQGLLESKDTHRPRTLQ